MATGVEMVMITGAKIASRADCKGRRRGVRCSGGESDRCRSGAG